MKYDRHTVFYVYYMRTICVHTYIKHIFSVNSVIYSASSVMIATLKQIYLSIIYVFFKNIAWQASRKLLQIRNSLT